MTVERYFIAGVKELNPATRSPLIPSEERNFVRYDSNSGSKGIEYEFFESISDLARACVHRVKDLSTALVSAKPDRDFLLFYRTDNNVAVCKLRPLTESELTEYGNTIATKK